MYRPLITHDKVLVLWIRSKQKNKDGKSMLKTEEHVWQVNVGKRITRVTGQC